MNKKLILFMTSLSLALSPMSVMAHNNTAPKASIEAVEERATLKAATGAYKNWVQYDSAWRDITLGVGGDTMYQSGCLVTAIAILMVHSGATDEYGVDPGKLCTYLTNNGGFNAYSELVWSKVSGAVEGFKFSNFRIELKGSQQDKAEKIKRYLDMGYYIVVNVGNGGHWVAIDRVDDDGTVYMFDPGYYGETVLFDFYRADGVISMATFTSTGKGNGSISGSASEVTKYDATGRVDVGASYLNVRSGVGTGTSYLKNSSGKQVTLKDGEEVVITGKAKDSSGNLWYRIFIDGAVGYVYAAYVDVLSASQMVSGEGKPAKVTGSLVNIRNGAGLAYATIGSAPMNAEVRVYDSKTDSQGNVWYKVKYGNTVGYMISDYVKLDEDKNNGSSETIYSESKAAKVNAALVNMRKEAKYSASVLKELSLNTKVTVLGETKDSSGTKWYKINYNGTVGYMVAEFVTITNDNTAAGDYSEAKNGVVNDDYVYVRTGAGTQNSKVTSLRKNTAVTVVGEAKDSLGTVWYKIKFSGGEGYMRHDFIDIKTSSNTNNNNSNTNTSYAEKKGKVKESSVNVRKGAGTNNSIVACLAKNTAVTIVGEAKDSSGAVWYKIKFSGGEGYMRHDFITIESGSSSNNNSSNNSSSNSGSYTEKAGKVNGNNVNIRKGAGTSNQIVGSLSTGAAVTVIGEAKDSSGAVWYKIKYSGGQGYMHSSYVTITTGSTSSGSTATPTPTPSYTAKKAVVNGDYVYVRTGAGTSNSKKTSLMKNAAITVIGEAKDSSGDLWYKIQYSGGEGYMFSEYVTFTQGSTSSGSTANTGSSSSSTGNTGSVNVPTEGVAGKEGVVNADLVRVREGSNTSSKIVEELEKGTSVMIESAVKDNTGIVWYKVSYAGVKGYMMGQYLTVK